MSNIEKLNKLTVGDHSAWFEEARERIKNKDWLDFSAEIAMKVFEELRRTGRTQEDLAKAMGVTPQRISTILSGSENLSIKTIFRLERAVGMKLVTLVEGMEKTISNQGYVNTSVPAVYLAEPSKEDL